MRSLVWFRGKDLRLADHEPLSEALSQGEVIPLFVLDPFFFEADRARRLPHRIQFLLQSLAALEAAIAARGSRLVIVSGRSVDLIPELARRWRVDQVSAHRWSEPFGVERDRRIATELEASGIPLRLFEGETLAPPGSVSTGDGGMFRVFTPFARAFQRQIHPGRPVPSPRSLPPLPRLEVQTVSLPNLDALGILPNPRLPAGGEAAAQERLESFLRDRLEGYRLRRDAMAEGASSRLSADLHFGTLSIRTLWHAVSQAQHCPVEDSQCFLNQLLWREFAHHLMALEPGLLTRPFRPRFDAFPWRQDTREWVAWTQGTTGFPVVDAAARQLRAEGFVHNRARMVAACFLAKHLLQGYQGGEAHYLEWLVDGDWANNNLGWQWSAGCGVDAQPWFRVFNPVVQGERFDPEGAYVKRWIPELADLDARWIHRPWEAPARPGRAKNYPPPILDLRVARARFLATAKAHLKGDSSGLV
jgi:deoxyribodipyrimidine photo-lyase